MRKRYKLNIVITEVNSLHDWWFYLCKVCWKKTIPTGNSYRCPSSDAQRSSTGTSSVNATDVEPNPENKRVIGQFMFLGDHGATLTGKDAILLAATTRGRPDFAPPAIADTVGKKCVVVAEVTQETLDADDGLIILTV